MFHLHSRHHGQRHARDAADADGPHGRGGHHRFGRGGGDFEGGRGGRSQFGRGGRGGDLGRFFAHGDLRLVILQLIAEKPRYGYEIIKAIEERVGGAYSPSPGTVYPTMTLLDELGYVTVSAGDGTKKLHEITAEGRAFLDANRRAVDALFARMAQAAEAAGDGPPSSVLRGMENLRLALRLRLGNGPLNEAQVAGITAALDAAAVAIERDVKLKQGQGRRP